MEPWCHVDYDVDKLYFRPISRCLGGKPAHSPLMEYELQYLHNYRGVPRLSWTIYLEGEPHLRDRVQSLLVKLSQSHEATPRTYWKACVRGLLQPYSPTPLPNLSTTHLAARGPTHGKQPKTLRSSNPAYA